jgi:hypothetical protein
MCGCDVCGCASLAGKFPVFPKDSVLPIYSDHHILTSAHIPAAASRERLFLPENSLSAGLCWHSLDQRKGLTSCSTHKQRCLPDSFAYRHTSKGLTDSSSSVGAVDGASTTQHDDTCDEANPRWDHPSEYSIWVIRFHNGSIWCRVSLQLPPWPEA